jgi:hypothetical protein
VFAHDRATDLEKTEFEMRFLDSSSLRSADKVQIRKGE